MHIWSSIKNFCYGLLFSERFWFVARNGKYLIWISTCLCIASSLPYFCYGSRLAGWGACIFGGAGIGMVAFAAACSVIAPHRLPTASMQGTVAIHLFYDYNPSSRTLLQATKRNFGNTPEDRREDLLDETVEDLRRMNILGPLLVSLTLSFVYFLLCLIVIFASLALCLEPMYAHEAFVKTFNGEDPPYLVEQSKWHTCFNHVYFTTVTMVTLGYGDFAPRDVATPPRVWSVAAVLSFVITITLLFPSAVSQAQQVESLKGSGDLKQWLEDWCYV